MESPTLASRRNWRDASRTTSRAWCLPPEASLGSLRELVRALSRGPLRGARSGGPARAPRPGPPAPRTLRRVHPGATPARNIGAALAEHFLSGGITACQVERRARGAGADLPRSETGDPVSPYCCVQCLAGLDAGLRGGDRGAHPATAAPWPHQPTRAPPPLRAASRTKSAQPARPARGWDRNGICASASASAA